jgi:hypothetical protein
LEYKSGRKEEKNETAALYENVMGNYPKIENIHNRILDAVTSRPDALDMSTWHTCETTHCRAGWVVQLAGDAGAKLERQTSTLFAAMQIYKVSSSVAVSPVRFFESNEIALEDIKKCAELESATN